jgi:excisionase family DNA binding protein
MVHRSSAAGEVSGRTRPSAPAGAEVGLAAEDIVRALEGLRSQLQDGLAMLARQIEGRHKSHYTIDEVAALTGRAPYTVRAWIKRGMIAATRVRGTGPKGRLLVSHDELQRLIAAGRGQRVPAIAAGGLS